MAKTFSDFSALKSLKKDLPKEVPQAPAPKTEQPKRQKTITLKSKEEEHANNDGFRKGQKVRMIDSSDEGIIVGFVKDGVKIELEDGLTINAGFYDFYVVNAEDDSKLRKSVSAGVKKSKQEARKTSSPQNEVLEVDLHLERIPGWENVASWAALDNQMEYFKTIIRKNQKFHGKKIVFIHGEGEGRLKEAIRKELDEVFNLCCTYTVGQWQQYGMGATTVTIK